jgi:hypothetical protein
MVTGVLMSALDPYALLATFLVGGVGFVLFRYGRRQRRFPQTSAGLLMLLYPFFVTDIALMLGLCAALLLLVWLAVRAGL